MLTVSPHLGGAPGSDHVLTQGVGPLPVVLLRPQLRGAALVSKATDVGSRLLGVRGAPAVVGGRPLALAACPGVLWFQSRLTPHFCAGDRGCWWVTFSGVRSPGTQAGDPLSPRPRALSPHRGP